MSDTWTLVSGYTASDYADDMVWEVDTGTKKLVQISGQALVAGEENSQYIVFKMDRYWDGIDISGMTINIMYELNTTYFGTSTAVAAEITDDSLRFGWIVPSTACCVTGTLLFVLVITDTDYTLKTQIATTSVYSTISEDDVVPEPTSAAWYEEFQTRVDAALDNAENALSQAQSVLAQAQTYVGAPLVASTAAGMTDTSKVYVYVGSETGYTSGNWYYYDSDNSAWTSGGVYNAVAVDTDTTLSVSGKAADAEATGDAITQLNAEITAKPSIVEPEETEADLYVCDENGNVIAEFADGHIKTKNFDSSEAGANMVKDASSSEADLYVCDSFGNVVMELKDGHIVTKNFNSADYSSVLTNISTLLSDVSALQTATSGIVYRNMDATDGVFASCNYKQGSPSDKQFCMLMGGDIHADAPRMNSMVEYLNAVDAFDCGIMLGDIAGNTWADDATFYTEAISATEKPFLTVIGNHDAGSGNTLTTSYTNIADLVAKFITPNIGYADLASGEYVSGNSYYYKDFADYGIRVIVLNEYEYPTDNDGETFTYTRGNNCYSQEQITWFCNTLLATPSDYAVIIAQHFAPTTIIFDRTGTDADWVSSTMTGNSYGPHTMFTYEDKDCLAEIVQAWIDGSALSKTYAYTVTTPWSGVTVNVDFSARGTGEFITWIGGHLHMSLLGHINQYPQQRCYYVDCSGLYASTQGDTGRRISTRSEDAICALSVDRSKKTVKLFRVGAHFTKDGLDRLYGQYSYDVE